MAFNMIVALSGILLAITTADDQNLQKRVLSVGCKGDNCPKPKTQSQETFRPTSCLDYLSRGASKCGIYKFYDNAGNSYPAYCDLKSEPGTAWTLVMSWANIYRKLPAFLKIPFKYNAQSERKRPQLEFLPLKSGTNEFPSRSFYPLASNVRLPNLWCRLQGLPPWQLQRLQHL